MSFWGNGHVLFLELSAIYMNALACQNAWSYTPRSCSFYTQMQNICTEIQNMYLHVIKV